MTSAKTSNQVSFSVAIDPFHHDRPYQEFFEKFVPMQYQECINPNCSVKKQSAIKHIWHADILIYKPNEDHMASPTLNIITMLVNGEQFTVMSHYCCDCFKQQVKKDRSARQRANQEKRTQEKHLKEEEEKAKAQTND